MRILVRYEDGSGEDISTSDATTLDAFRGDFRDDRSANIATRFVPRLDLIESEGLRIDIYWYDVREDSQTTTTLVREYDRRVSDLALEEGRVWHVIPPEKVARIVSLDIDGFWRMRRMFGCLVDMEHFERERRVWLGSEASGRPLVAQVVDLHEAIRLSSQGTRGGEWDDERIAGNYGWPVMAYERVLAARQGECADSPAGASSPNYAAAVARWRARNRDGTMAEAYRALPFAMDTIKESWDAAEDLAESYTDSS